MTNTVHQTLEETVRRVVVALTLCGGTLALVPLTSAHRTSASTPAPQWVAVIPLLMGLSIAGASGYLFRRRWIERATTALAVAFLGLLFVAIGGIGLVQLSTVSFPSIRYSPIARSLYEPLTLIIGTALIFGSLVVGRLQWPNRPRYAGLGILLGLWVAYPAIQTGNGMGPLANPLGYLVVFATVGAIGYVLWTDCRKQLITILADPVTRRFGGGVAFLGTLFFMFSTGMLTFIPDSGEGLPMTHPLTAITPLKGPLVYWPAFEFWYPSVPLGGFLSVGMVLLVGTLSVLVALNAALVAHRWRCRDTGDTAQGTAGTAALAAPNACCCCGPALAQLAIVAFSPSIAAPIYWLFVDIASPIGSLFFAASVALLTGNIVQSTEGSL